MFQSVIIVGTKNYNEYLLHFLQAIKKTIYQYASKIYIFFLFLFAGEVLGNNLERDDTLSDCSSDPPSTDHPLDESMDTPPLDHHLSGLPPGPPPNVPPFSDFLPMGGPLCNGMGVINNPYNAQFNRMGNMGQMMGNQYEGLVPANYKFHNTGENVRQMIDNRNYPMKNEFPNNMPCTQEMLQMPINVQMNNPNMHEARNNFTTSHLNSDPTNELKPIRVKSPKSPRSPIHTNTTNAVPMNLQQPQINQDYPGFVINLVSVINELDLKLSL